MFGLFKDFSDKLGEHFIETFFLSMIEEFTIKDLELAVKEDISLLDQAQIYNSRALAFAEKMAKRFNGYKDFLTLENVLTWTKIRRNDLYWHFLREPVAKVWLGRQIKEFKTFLFEY